MTHLCHKPRRQKGPRFCSAAGCLPEPSQCYPLGRAQEGADRPRLNSEQSGLPRRKPMLGIRRREFITALGGAAAWPFAASGQQAQRMRRIGVLMPDDENDPLAKSVVSAFTQALAGLGWTDGRNVRIDRRWVGSDDNRIRELAQELV